MKIHSVSSGNVQTNAAGQAPRAVSARKNTTATAQVGERKATQQTAQPEARQTEALNPRLAAYARNVDTRLKVAIENSAKNPREQAALQAAQQHFHSMVLRLDDAFLTAGKPKLDMTPGAAMSRLLDHLTGAVQSVLTHGAVDVKA